MRGIQRLDIPVMSYFLTWMWVHSGSFYYLLNCASVFYTVFLKNCKIYVKFTILIIFKLQLNGTAYIHIVAYHDYPSQNIFIFLN